MEELGAKYLYDEVCVCLEYAQFIFVCNGFICHLCHLFVHSSDGGPLGFHLLALVNNAAVNMSVQIPVHIPAFSSLEYMPRSGIAASW